VAKNITESIFNSRVNLYENFPQLEGIKYFDLQRRHVHYGRVDFDCDAVYLDGPLKQVFSGPTGGDQFAVEFVAEAFKQMRSNVLKMRNSNFIVDNGYFPTNLLVKKSQTYGDLDSNYDLYINKIYTNFVNNYLSVDRRAEKIKSYKDFVLSFVEHMLPNLKYFPITRTGYITSVHCSPFVSGLMMEVASESHGIGSDSKILNYTVDDFANFVFYAKELKKFGFLIDRNAPWRFVFNIASGLTSRRKDQNDIKGAQIFLDRFGVSYDNVFPFYYRKAYRDELFRMQNLFLSLYRSFYLQFPTYEEAKIVKSNSVRCFDGEYKTTRKNRSNEEMLARTQKEHDEIMLKIILKIRLMETDTKAGQHEINGYVKEMLSNKRLFSNEAALNYINDLTKGFLVTKLNVEGSYWHGVNRSQYRQTKQRSLDEALDGKIANYDLVGSKNLQRG